MSGTTLKFIVVDAITEIAAFCSEAAIIDFFSSCKRSCTQGKTIVLSADSYAFNAEMFRRLGTLCDSYLRLQTEKVRGKSITTIEVRKVNASALTRDNTVSFAVEPGVGMRLIPLSKTQA